MDIEGQNEINSVYFPNHHISTSNQKKIERNYKMDYPKRGLALIFNHEFFFNSKSSERTGTDIDCKNLKRTLGHLNFNVEIHEDLKYKKILKVLKEVSRRDLSMYSCLWVTVLTHGKLGLLSAFDTMYREKVIWSFFKSSKCPSLDGKPKMFFFQSCRANYGDSGTWQVDNGITLEEKTHNIKDMINTSDNENLDYIATDLVEDKKENEENGAPIIELQNDPDFLIVHSTQPGFISFRNTDNGSWFIDALCYEILKNGMDNDFLTLLTFVNQRVAIKYESNSENIKKHKKKQMPCITSTLRRLIEFVPKNYDS